MQPDPALLSRLLRRGTVLTFEPSAGGPQLAIRGGPALRPALRQALAALQRRHGLHGAVEQLRRCGRPRLRADGFQVGLTLDAELAALLGQSAPTPGP